MTTTPIGFCNHSKKLLNGALTLVRPFNFVRPQCFFNADALSLLCQRPFFVLNGPNLNLLGTREPEVYGSTTLKEIENTLVADAKALDLAIDFRQSNSEGELIDWIQEARTEADGIILNAGAYTHTSAGILDALQAASLPCVEVHISNVFQREPFRHHSFISTYAFGVICGLGPKGYEYALSALANRIN